jgi:methyl-accepting chemotaxis protein
MSKASPTRLQPVRQQVKVADSNISIVNALDRLQARIDFNSDGTIIDANTNFLAVMGYSLDEIRGQNHRMFVTDSHRQSAEYRDFWLKLNQGESQSGEFQRMAKNGREVWIQGSYCPILNENRQVTKVVKYAVDVTRNILKRQEQQRVLEALERLQARIEFNSDGTIVDANNNFLAVMGYSLEEIRGRNHSMFVSDGYRQSAEYRNFWAHLNRGEAQSGEFHRLAKNGKEVWIQGSYCPVIDSNGKVARVVKFAVDITQRTQDRQAAVEREKQTKIQIEDASVQLNSASSELTSIAAQLASGATQTSAQASRVASAANQIKANVTSVASASEEMSSTVRNIASNAAESAQTARQARDLANGANTTVQALSESSAAIGKVTKVISTIAQQTNLLALNATIEAARAGEAGKGFAVVANEVKELAKATARATEEIAQQIENIQGATGKSVTSIGDVVRIIEQIDGFATSIAAAVEQQAATVRDIARNANEVSQGVGSVVENIDGVAQAAKDAERNAAMTQTSAGNVKEMAMGLSALVANA